MHAHTLEVSTARSYMRTRVCCYSGACMGNPEVTTEPGGVGIVKTGNESDMSCALKIQVANEVRAR